MATATVAARNVKGSDNSHCADMPNLTKLARMQTPRATPPKPLAHSQSAYYYAFMTNATPVFHNSRVPLYLQVAKLMRHRIENGEWPYGAQIPTLDELEREYKVSRITLRGALDQLQALGIVKRTRGLGTF